MGSSGPYSSRSGKNHDGRSTVLVWCKACCRQADADLQALVAAGRGDVPLIRLRFRCSNCGSRLTDWVGNGEERGTERQAVIV